MMNKTAATVIYFYIWVLRDTHDLHSLAPVSRHLLFIIVAGRTGLR